MQVQGNNLNRFKAKIFKALSDPIRLEIIEYIRDGEKCVCEITPHLNLIQPLVSRHLKILKDSGLVAYRKDGNKRLYSIPNQKILEVVDSLTPSIIDSLSNRLIEQIVAG
jgi:ArsR family transcriptional regulator